MASNKKKPRDPDLYRNWGGLFPHPQLDKPKEPQSEVIPDDFEKEVL